MRVSSQDIKDHIFNQVAKAVSRKQRDAEEKLAKLKNKDKKFIAVLPSADPARIPDHEVYSDTTRKQSRHNQFGTRQIAYNNGVHTVSSVNKFDPLDVALASQSDTFDVGTDCLFNDTVG